jgi:membrane-associated phospholipid phosphatase
MVFAPRVVITILCVAVLLPRPSVADEWHPSLAGHMADLFAAPALSTVEPLPTLALARPNLLQAAPKPPEPEHTGVGALAKHSLGDFVAFPKRKSTWVILAIGLSAAALAHPVDDKVQQQIQGSDAWGKFFAPGKYIGSWYVMTAASVGTWAVGRYVLPHEGESRTNKVSHLGLDLIRGQILSQVIVQGMKNAVRRDRPTGECCAFPSGHAASAFAAASILERHLGYRFALTPFFVALYVGASRLHDNVHYLSDVMMGAAVGTAAGWTVVGSHGRGTFAFAPVPVGDGILLAFTRVEPGGKARSTFP